MPVVGTALSSFFTAVGAAGVGTFLTEKFVGRLLVSVATSALLSATAGKSRAQRTPGITTQFAQTGADNALSFPIGTYATPGTRLCPWLSHGKEGGTPRAYLTLAVAVSAVPGVSLSRVAINGEWVTLGSEAHADYGLPFTGAFAGYAWVKWLDGSQTSADPMMLAKYGNDPDFPWAADMVGQGMCIAYVTFRYNREIFSNLPTVVFETTGIPLYDPRKDSTVGGTGTHRWADITTWEPSNNTTVQSYNIARGITLFTGDVWGGRFDDWRLPLANWIAAMDACDEDVDGVAQFRTGFEVTVDTQPSAVLQELAKGCAAQFAETAGMLKVRVGAPTLPVMVVSDGDFLISKESTESPFPSASRVWNGARSSYPEPENIYASEVAPLLTDATLEAEDNGQRNLADLQFGAVADVAQVQRLAWSLVQDNRRFRRHAGSLQGAAALLEPLDALAWNSDRHGYTGKTFEIAEIAHDLRACLARVSLLERDSADWSPPPEAVLPRTPTGTGVTAPDAFVVPGWQITQTEVYDSTGVPRRPAVRLSWSGTDLDAVDGVQWQLKDDYDNVIASGTSTDVISGSAIVTEGVLSGARYAARGKLVAPFPTDWTGWSEITAPTVLLSPSDFDPSVADYVEDISSRSLTALELENINIIEQDNQHPDWVGSVSAVDYVADNMAAYGDMADVSLWVSRAGSFVDPADVWVADVDGQGTPGFYNDSGQRVWIMGTEAVNIVPGRSYRLAVDLYREAGVTAPNRFVWSPDGETAIEFRGISSADLTDDAWVRVTVDVTSEEMLADFADPTGSGAVQVGIAIADGTNASNGPVRARNFEITDLSDPVVPLVANGDLYLTPNFADLTVIYQDDSPFDLVDVFQVRVKAAAGVEFWNADYTWDTWGTWDTVARWAGSTAGCSAQTQVRTTLDDPADMNAAWTGWAAPSTLLVKARGVQTRIVLTFGAAYHRARITYATTIIDVPDRTASARGVAVPDTGLDYSFAPAFRDIPVIVATHISPANGERLIVSGEAADGVRLDIVDATGTGVAGTVNIYAKGYGRKEEL